MHLYILTLHFVIISSIMKSRYNLLLGICIASVAGLVSCVSSTDELDLNKEVKLDMHLAPSGISLPLGNLSKIYLIL